jgi:hypothetical protein
MLANATSQQNRSFRYILTQWQVPTALRTRQTDFGTVQNLADHGTVVGFNGSAQGTVFASSGFIVNCPIISQQS